MEDTELLRDAEGCIVDALRTIYENRLRLCEYFSFVERNRLYECIGLTSFKEYLLQGRLPISYHTAYQYAVIGNAFHAHREYLASIGFDQKHGITKLLYLERALDLWPDKGLVGRHLLSDTFRQFRDFAKKSIGADGCNDSESASLALTARIVDDTVVVQLQDGCAEEVVWFNPDAFPSHQAYQRVTRLVAAVVSHVFVSGG